MLKLRSTGRAFGTPVPCPACHYPNLGINIWCERCRTPLDWQRGAGDVAPPEAVAPEPPAAPPAPEAGLRVFCQNCGAPNSGGGRYCFRCGAPMIREPAVRRAPAVRPVALAIPRIRMPTMSMPAFRLVRPAVPRLSRTAWIVAAIVATLLIAPLAYVLFPAGRAAAVRPGGSRASAASTATVPTNSPEGAAIRGVEAKTGLRFSATCKPNVACLSLAKQMVGQEAAAVIFSTANPGGRQCAGYVYRSGGSWHFLDAACGLPGQLSPLVGQTATVHVPSSCANVRDRGSLSGGVVTCLYDGTVVHIDGGPTYADGRLWWHLKHGWLAHDFLKAP